MKSVFIFFLYAFNLSAFGEINSEMVREQLYAYSGMNLNCSNFEKTKTETFHLGQILVSKPKIDCLSYYCRVIFKSGYFRIDADQNGNIDIDTLECYLTSRPLN